MNSRYFEPDVSRALIYAPIGRDAEVAGSLLDAAGVSSRVCGDLIQLGHRLGDDTSLAVLTEEAIGSMDLRSISAWIEQQPTWSDLPFIILTQRGGGPERNPNAARLSEIHGNVTLLERPFHPTTYISMARAALRGPPPPPLAAAAAAVHEAALQRRTRSPCFEQSMAAARPRETVLRHPGLQCEWKALGAHRGCGATDRHLLRPV